MSHHIRHRAAPAAAAAALAFVALSACAAPQAATPKVDSGAQVEHTAGTGITRLRLSPEAVNRIGLQTATVREIDVNGARLKVVPYAAVLYDPEGKTYAYVNPQPFVYLRNPLVVDHIDGDQALLAGGPPVGTAVVTVGAAELFGTEFEVGE